MDIKLECADLLVRALVFVWGLECVCVCLCVVRKLPTDKSPREVLEQVCVGLVWREWSGNVHVPVRMWVLVCLCMMEKQAGPSLTKGYLICFSPDVRNHHR